MLNKISFYQFDNLVQSRIPFILLNLGPSLKDLYNSVYKMHVEAHEILTDESRLFDQLAEKKVPLDAAVLLICENGQKSGALHAQLETKGYSNVYLIDGGHQQLMTERAQS